VGADGLDGLVVAGRSQHDPDLPAAVARIAKHLQPRRLLGQQGDPDRPVRGVGWVSTAAVTSPVSGSTAKWAL
jgi:hypothetical protein